VLRADGRYVRTAGEDGPKRTIALASNLKGVKFDDTLAHEAAHIADEIAGLIPVDGIKKELAQVYSDLNGGKQGLTKRMMTPEAVGYEKGDESDRELIAEFMRDYMIDPNYAKSLAPNAAKRVREYVNKDPRLKSVIQFNSVAAAIAAAGVGPAFVSLRWRRAITLAAQVLRAEGS